MLIKYRPDIDGLRALAIAAVVVFHVNPEYLGGGFVGVDVFFVISGFLITSIINRELNAGKFSLADFYKRRIRRIAPALLAVLLTTIVVGFFVMLPDDYVAMAKSMVYATASFSNIHFLDIKSDYYNNVFSQIPLIHTWSLGVEEQFYLVFPILLMALHRVTKTNRALVVAVAGIMLLSFVASVYYVAVNPQRAFFLLPFRMWELLTGSLLALAGKPRIGARTENILSLAGLGLILVSMIFYSEKTPFPGLAAVVPCMGAMLLILTGREGNTWASRILSLKPLVALGLISYSIYLWHWPLIAFAKYSLWTTRFGPFFLLSTSVILGALSWRLIEQPFRNNKGIRGKNVFASWLVASVALIAIGRTIEIQQGFPARFSQETIDLINYKTSKSPANKTGPIGFNFLASPKYGDLSAEPSVVLWGDSYAKSLLPLIDSMAKENGVNLRCFGRGGVPPIIGLVPRAKDSQSDQVLSYTQGILDHIISQSAIKTVILSAHWSLYTHCEIKPSIWSALGYEDESPENLARKLEFFATQLRCTVSDLVAAGKQVIIVYPVPEPGYSVPDYLAKHSAAGIPLPTATSCRDFEEREAPVVEALDSIPDQHVTRIRPAEKLLHGQMTTIMVDRKPLYFDGYHLSPPGAFYLRDLFVPVFEQLRTRQGH